MNRLTAAFFSRLGLVALLSTMLMLPGGSALARTVTDEIKLFGDVVVRPATSDALGEWKVRGFLENDQTGALYTVLVDGATEIVAPLPRLRDRVEVRGVVVGPGLIRAVRLRRKALDAQDVAFEGEVLEHPQNVDGVGRWRVQTNRSQILTIKSDFGSSFPRGVPQRGDWVEVRARILADGSLLLLRMRVDRFEEDQIVVRLRPGVKPLTLAERRQLRLIYSVLPSANMHLFSAADGEENLDDLLQILNGEDTDLVVWAELNYSGGIPEGNPYDTWAWSGVDPDDFASQSSFDQIGWTAVAGRLKGDGLIVAVVDTGVSHTHPLLQPRLLPGRDLVDDDLLADDEPGGAAWGHGTHVAGIIAQIAPHSRMIPLRVLNPQGRGNSFIVAYAIELAVKAGADVVNLSLGTEVDSRILRETVAWAAAQNVVLVAAAGNLNSEAEQYPAAYDEVISVTAVDGENRKAEFASYGDDWITLAAPGVGITSTIVGPEGPGFAVWSGTSMATSFVSGAGLLGRERYPDLSASALSLLLEERTTNIENQNPNYAGQLGSGLLNLTALLSEPRYDSFLYLPHIVQTP